MNEDTKPLKLVAFLCNWCSYAGADLAGVSRFKYEPDIRIIRVPCSGRVDPQLPLLALQQGADGVLISGCHPGDCHYSDGNHYARRRFAIVRDLMDFMGMDPRRLQMSWVSASEGKKWADVVNAVVAEVRAARDDAAKVATQASASAATIPVDEERSSSRTICEDKDLTGRLHDLACELFASGKVKAVIGHGKRASGRDGATVRFVTRPEDVEKLSAFLGCTPNFAQYLKAAVKDYGGPVAMVGKGSDFFSVANLEREGQIPSGSVYRIVIACDGILTEEGSLVGRCISCLRGARETADTVLGVLPEAGAVDDFLDVANLESLSRLERAAFWESHFTNCLRCYACRNACPSCSCPVCFADNRKPTWVFPSASVLNNAFFHLVRAYHLAGRCSGCGECERVCPMDVPLLTLARKVAKTVHDRFGHEPVIDLGEKNPLCRFHASEEMEFIR